MPAPQTIRSASFTRIKDFEGCRYMARLKYIDRVPQPPFDPPPGKAEHPIVRGSRVHDEAEQFVLSKVDEPPKEFRKLVQELTYGREMIATGRGSAEQLWAYTKKWQPLPLGEYGYWHVKVDLSYHITNTHLGVADYKTGRSYGKQFEHTQQAQLYCIGLIMRFPFAELATGELWYTDEGKVSPPVNLTRRQATALATSWSARAERMTEATVFPPNPSKMQCKWCPYGSNVGNGYCDKDAYA